jgi:phage gp45-like
MMMYTAFLVRDSEQRTFRKYKIAQVEGLADQEMTVPVLQHYGFTSMPPADAAVIVLADGNNYAIVAEDHDDRAIIETSETLLYNSDQGTSVYLKKNGDVCITGPKASVTISGSNGDITMASQGTISLGPSGGAFQKLVDARIIDLINKHLHTVVVGAATLTTSAPTVQIVANTCSTATTQAA